MGLKAMPLTPSQNGIVPKFGCAKNVSRFNFYGTKLKKPLVVLAKKDNYNNEEEQQVKKKQSLFSSVTEALDFSQVRSEKDAELLDEAREATQSGGRMSREQYGALRRKIGGTYKDFFKSYVEVDGQYVEEGWVDKTCKICKKDTREEARQVDKLGRYAHVACLENKANNSSNFFAKLFSR